MDWIKSGLLGLLLFLVLPLGRVIAADVPPPRPIDMDAVRSAADTTAAYQAEMDRYRRESEAYAQDLASRVGPDTASAILNEQAYDRLQSASQGAVPATSPVSPEQRAAEIRELGPERAAALEQQRQAAASAPRSGGGSGMRNPAAAYTGLLESIRQNANQWWRILQRYALSLFWMLATIQLVWTFIPLVLRGADLGEILNELVKFFLVIGFFAALLLYSSDWATAIVDSFRIAGGRATGLGDQIWPGDVLTKGVSAARMVMETDSWNPFTGVAHVVAGGIVLFSYGFMAAFLGVTLVESYIVINASVLFLGFGASTWTREYALAMIRYCVSVGAKLFVLTLLVGVILQTIQEWSAAYDKADASMWTMAALALCCAYLAKQIPDLVQGLITGTSMGGGGAILGGMAGAGTALAMTGASAVMGNIPGVVGGLAGAAKGVTPDVFGGSSGVGGSSGGIGASDIGGGGTSDTLAKSILPRVGGSLGGGGGRGAQPPGQSGGTPSVGGTPGPASPPPAQGSQSSQTPSAPSSSGPSEPTPAGGTPSAPFTSPSPSGPAPTSSGPSESAPAGGTPGTPFTSPLPPDTAPSPGASSGPSEPTPAGGAPNTPFTSSPSSASGLGVTGPPIEPTPAGGTSSGVTPTPAEPTPAGGAPFTSSPSGPAPTSSGLSESAPAGGAPGALSVSPTRIVHGISDAMARTATTMAAISVPGMEGVAGMSIGPNPPETSPPDSDFKPKDDVVQNTISPASVSAPVGISEISSSPSPPTSTSSEPVTQPKESPTSPSQPAPGAPSSQPSPASSSQPGPGAPPSQPSPASPSQPGPVAPPQPEPEHPSPPRGKP